MKILGLDASTSTIGVGLIESNNGQLTLLHHEYFKPPKKDLHMIETLFHVKNYIAQLINTHNPDHIALEEFIPFMKGKSTAATTISLGILNRTVGVAIFEVTGKLPELLHVMQIRHLLKKKVLPKKEDIPELVADHLGIPFPYYCKPSKKGPVQLKENGDVADAIAVALASVKKRSKDEAAVLAAVAKASRIKKHKK